MSMERWDKMARPPAGSLKPIVGGRLAGKSDINPMWRYRVMTEVFGECGIGWKFEIVKLWTEQAPEQQVFAFAHVNLYTRAENGWSDPIPGIGGHFLIVKEKNGLHANDECFKMAVTDALGTAMKMLGVAADIYAGLWDGSKYRDTPDPAPSMPPQATKPAVAPPASPQGQSWEGTNKYGKPFRSTGRFLPLGWFERLKADREAAIQELGGRGFGAEKNPATGRFEIVEFVDPPAQRQPGEESTFDPNTQIEGDVP